MAYIFAVFLLLLVFSSFKMEFPRILFKMMWVFVLMICGICMLVQNWINVYLLYSSVFFLLLLMLCLWNVASWFVHLYFNFFRSSVFVFVNWNRHEFFSHHIFYYVSFSCYCKNIQSGLTKSLLYRILCIRYNKTSVK